MDAVEISEFDEDVEVLQLKSLILAGDIEKVYDIFVENELSISQLSICELDEDRVVLKAGCGSGKSRVLMARAMKDVKSPSEFKKILILGFARNSCYELRKRFRFWFGDDVLKLLGIFTFHSFALGRLNNDRKRRNLIAYSPMEEDQVKEVLDKLYQRSQFVNLRLFEEENIGRINKVNYLLNVEGRNKEEVGNLNIQFYEAFKKELLDNYKYDSYQTIDYYSIIIEYLLLLKSSSYEQDWISRYSTILVEEFQDIDLVQYEILKMLWKDKKSFSYGDPDQNIFHVMGNTIEYIDCMRRDYPKFILKELTFNHRSTKTIQYALYCLKNNKIARKVELGDDFEECIFHVAVQSYKDQFIVIESVAKCIIGEEKTMYILSRTNDTVKKLSKYFRRKKIKHELWTDYNHKHSDVVCSSCFRTKGGQAYAVGIMNFNFLEFPHVSSKVSETFFMSNPELKDKHEKTERRLIYTTFGRAEKEIWLTSATNMSSAPSFFHKKENECPGISPFYSNIRELVVPKTFEAVNHPGIQKARDIGAFQFSWK